MTTAQDQQSREEFDALGHSKGWNMTAIMLMSMPPKFSRYADGGTQAAYEAWQAARALPAPENVREGEPYDNPAFEDLARTMGVWGTAQSAMCAQFFLAGRGAVPAAPLQEPDEPAGYIEATGERYYTASQVQAMGRVPPEWKPEPAAGHCRFSGAPWAECSVEHVRMVLAAPQEWNGYEVRYLYAATPRPPDAQEDKTVACACGDEFPVDSYGAGFLDAKGMCFGCDAAETANHQTGD